MSLSERIAALSPQQRELLRRRLAERGRASGASSSSQVPLSDARIPRRDPDAPLPLSHAQERLWFLNRLEQGSAFYNIPMGLRMRGPLDPAALLRALQEVVRRHEVLRTTFVSEGGVPRQQVHADLPPDVARVDHSDVAFARREAVLAAAARDEARMPFDMERGPLIRAALVHFAPDDHGFLLSVHHTVADGWSRGVIVGELERLYAAFVDGRPSPLEPLEVQYGDFAVWQRRWLSGQRLDSELRYWEQRLSGVRELRLPTDRPRSADTAHEGAKLLRVLPHALRDRLKDFSREARVTPFMVVLSAFKVLLSRLSGEDDVVVGVPTANRNWPATEPMVGFFVNSLIMRTDLGGDPSFRELLQRVRETAVGAFEHRNVPFERIVERLRPARTLGRNPLFQVTLQYQDASYGRQNSLNPKHDFPGLTIERLPIDTGTSLFDLSVNLGEIEEGLGVLVEYSTALWDAERIEALVRQLVQLLEDGMRRPEAPISALCWLDDAQRARVLSLAGESPSRDGPLPPLTEPVHVRVARHARAQPHAPAVVAGGHPLTYGELVLRARKLSAELVRGGAGPERVVVVCLPRGAGAVLASLSALEAGAAYLPMDPADPARRRRAMLVDAGAAVVVTDAAHAGEFAGDLCGGVTVVDVGPFLDEPLDPSLPERATTAVEPEQLAYVVYTSGSTGTPKGVGISHRALSHLLAWQDDRWPIGPGDRGTCLAGLAFDPVVWEVCATLAGGAALVLPPEELRLDPARLAAWLVREGITVAYAPTPIAERLLAEPRMRDAKALRVLFAGGDKLTVRPDRALPFTYVNVYGPAESTVNATAEIVAVAGSEGIAPPIGRPLPGVTAYVLDSRLRPVPVGAPGELYLGGRGLGRGYQGRPAQTASRFVPDPFSAAAGARLYRTGDRVRFLADGRLAFLGRGDHQVKVRGGRLELGEIEALLAAHGSLREVAVGTTGSGSGRALVAFVVPHDTASDEERAGRDDAHVSDWHRFYETSYGEPRGAQDGHDARFDLVGWTSSYDGRPIPREQMRSWVDETASRIFALAPKRVLEIGSGSGLLLYRIAPHVARYVGADFSAAAVDGVRRELSRPGGGIAGVELEVARADEIAARVDGSFDTLIMNSVVQYFPSVAYLERVIASAMQRVGPGGRMFFGDLRHAGLDRAFYASIALMRAADDEPLPAVAVRAEEAAARENELRLAPAFFHALSARHARIRGVQIRPKRHAEDNELSRFRYDVVIELDEAAPAAPGAAPPRVSFDRLGGLSGLRDHLARERPRALVVEGILNARVVPAAFAAAELFGELDESVDPEPALRLRARAESAAAGAVDPAALWRLGQELDLPVDVRFGAGADAGLSLELHVGETGTAPTAVDAAAATVHGSAPEGPSRARQLATELRSYLEDRLPAYMVPERFVCLPAMPLTRRGKLDRRRLEALDPGRRSAARRFVAPRDALEAKVAEVFGHVLSVEPVGALDDFFELGGHSLLATRVIAELEDALGVTLALRTLFTATTVEQLAAALASRATRPHEADAAAARPHLGEGGTPASTLVRRDFGDRPALASYGQRRLWLLERLLPGTATYHMPARARLAGPLDVPRLAAALDGLVARHESLRTALEEREGAGEGGARDVVQIVMPHASMPLSQIDLSAEPAAERATRADALAAAHARRAFDLARAPLARALLLRLGPEHHELVVSLHHAVADGWSVGIILRELGELYRAGGSAAALPALPIRYRDYAAWQREDARAQAEATWWRQQLDGAPPRLALPTDRPRPDVPSFKGGRVSVAIDQKGLGAMDALGRAHRATRFMVALAAWQIVVRALSGEDDLVLVSPVAGRRRPETHGLVGFFVNTLPLRTRVDGAARFTELLHATRATCLDAFDHADLPFEAILEAARVRRDLSGPPFSQVAFALQNAPGGRVDVDALSISIAALATGTAKTDLALMLDEPGSALGRSADGMSGVLEFATDLFEPRVAESIARGFEQVLAAACADPTRSVAGLAELFRLPSAVTASAPRPHRERSNLSDNQLLVWTGHQLDPEAPLYTLALALDIEAELDVASFEAALATLVRSADALRAIVVQRDGVPYLEVRDRVDTPCTQLDLSALASAERERRMRAFLFAPLDLSKETFRSALVRSGDGRTTWLFAQHQIVSDGETLLLMVRTLGDLYRRARSGTLPDAIALPSYLDHLAWERAQRIGGGFDAAAAHWQRLLEDRPEPPRFYGSTGEKSGLETHRVELALTAATAAQLERALADLGGGASHLVVRLRLFLAVLAAYVHRVSGQRRLVVGVPWRNRGRETARGTLGLFMRVVPIELEVSGEDSLRQLFERTDAALKRGFQHGEQVARNPIDAPVYDVALNLHTFRVGRFGDAPARPRWLHTGLGFESLTLQVEDLADTGTLRLLLDLHADVFDDALSALATRQLSTLLAAAVAAPDLRVDALPLEPAANTARSAAHPALGEAQAGATVLDAFDARVAANPRAVAVVDGDRVLDYGELDAEARAVAARLTAAGVGRGSVLALDLDRSAALLAAMLGVLRAGAGFLVLDPDTPAERARGMLAAAGARWVLAGPGRGALPSGPWTVWGADGRDPHREGDADVAPAAGCRLHPRDLAYIAFTSGSTGAPKGVVIEHGALASFVRAAVATYGLGPADRVLQFSSLAFDASIEEIFGALTSGASLVLRDGPMLVDPARFVARCAEAEVTVLDLPTTYWQQLSRTLSDQGQTWPACVRLIIVGGERLDPGALGPWRQQAAAGGAPALVNTYGPTETTVVVSHHAVSSEPEDPRWREVPIGAPLGAAELHVLDRHGVPAATGIVGELWVGGPTLARGYAGLPAATAARFLPDPFSGRPGARLYRTGDLVRRRIDGALMFVGRVDRQVKVRGHRVELAEIERALSDVEGVHDVAVLDVPAPSGVGRALIGFAAASALTHVSPFLGAETAGFPAVRGFRPRSDPRVEPAGALANPRKTDDSALQKGRNVSLTAADLRAALGARLPAFMVPARWVVLADALPRDARGKVDRRALLSLVPEQPSAEARYVAPRGEVARVVAEVWAQALGVARVGAHDNFFELGGTSLSLVQMHPLLVERLGASLELVDLFRHPTVHTLSQYLAGGAGDAGRSAEARDERAAARRGALERRRRRQQGEGAA